MNGNWSRNMVGPERTAALKWLRLRLPSCLLPGGLPLLCVLCTQLCTQLCCASHSWARRTRRRIVHCGCAFGPLPPQDACQKAIVDHGGFNWQLFKTASTPSKAQCASFMRGACKSDSQMQTAAVKYSIGYKYFPDFSGGNLTHFDLDLGIAPSLPPPLRLSFCVSISLSLSLWPSSRCVAVDSLATE